MKNEFLIDKLLQMQIEYKELLEKIIVYINTDRFWFVIDEINLFWYTKRKLVKLVLNNISRDFNGFLFTGATYLDIKCNEQFPFVIFGQEHIVDDPLNKYANIIENFPNGKSKDMLKQQIRLSIEDNIKILNECFSIIYILPVTFLSDLNSDMIKKGSEQAFLSLFKEQLTIKQVLSKFKSIEDMIAAMHDGIDKSLVFLEDEDINENIISRFNNYRKEIPLPYNNLNDISQFVITIIGFFAQAVNILLVSAQYKLIPYLRYDVTFRYVMNLSVNFNDNIMVKEMIFKSACVHLLYKMFDLKKVSTIDFMQFVEKVNSENLYEDYFCELNKKGINENTANFSIMTESIQRLLKKLY